MARHGEDRDDPMDEIRALVPRIELRFAGWPQPVVAGFRGAGGLSLYFGGDPAYHFDAESRLRRAFAADLLYRSQGHTLARLSRERTAAESVLLRHDLTPAELRTFLAELTERLTALHHALEINACEVLRAVPDDAVPLPRLNAALAAVLSRVPPGLSPRIKA